MPENKKSQMSIPSRNAEESAQEKNAQENPACEEESSSRDGKGEQHSRMPESKHTRCIQKILAAVGAFLDSLDGEEEPEPPPPPEKPLKESIQAFIGRCRDHEGRKTMLKEFGEWSWTMFFRGTVVFFLFVLTIWGTIRALDFIDNHGVKFYPSYEVVDYLTAEHESLEAAAYRVTPSAGKKDSIPLEGFDAKCIETVRPIRIYADEYGVYLMTSKGWYTGEHGIFIAKDEERMPPDINWGLIEGRIYTYAIYD